MKKKNMHLAALRATFDELLDELHALEHSEELASRMRRDGSPMFSDFDESDWSASKIVGCIISQCSCVVELQEQLPAAEFIDDDKFRSIVVAMLDMKQWAKDKLHSYVQDDTQRVAPQPHFSFTPANLRPRCKCRDRHFIISQVAAQQGPGCLQ